MAVYITQSDLETRFSQPEILELADRDADGLVDTGVIDTAIADAGDLIDSYISKRYDLPLSQTPTAIKKVACDLARYFLHDNEPSDRVAAGYKDAVSFLKDIAVGRAELDVGGVEPAGRTNAVIIDGPERVFTSKTLEDF